LRSLAAYFRGNVEVTTSRPPAVEFVRDPNSRHGMTKRKKAPLAGKASGEVGRTNLDVQQE